MKDSTRDVFRCTSAQRWCDAALCACETCVDRRRGKRAPYPAFSSVQRRLECGSASVGARVIGALRRTNTHAVTAQALRWPAPCINTMRVAFDVRLRQRSQSATRDHRARHNAVPRDASNKSATQQATQQHRTTASPRDHRERTPFLFLRRRHTRHTKAAGHQRIKRTSR
jgi:hypothetical protein